ncbi:cation diffusion facilitator family transporter [Aneurinibacillus aneurinilyticus]|jgi:cation diffusion facilitator family transporter|uniref:Phage holin, LL-H family n=1 Tax=Aneurinibacillus aneurinilyticus ATCC 12856 TaxID=649747 RepID=U1W8S6_ANEAE|nr:cation diffusion facilitator family transporter [Aneurinibacillus aneurinilyticus]ERI04894.1 phage holin, LL-H family [Aneurinibacillus aneurinilyticus ATCC 12856]MCI1694185.1 cation diffusion facilitator family transporter [Aneurinibacillus aneurinilyticus]MED0673628.1 cation diffusion facilitator family transporter [Aneurinibacillus aneurinilyticus]MED0708212.1 cation diffusion facilitator family transporter [Aneurinibacillus aneurinilyticus]MED0721435.1 cation diffusion facilitator famil
MKNSSSLIALWISLISNVVLTVLKVVVGYLFNSQVLIADGIHNAGDVIATFAALTSSLVSKKPADKDHPYGHGKAEVIASAIVAIILILAALLMVYKSVEALFEPAAEASIIALVAAFVSLIWKQGLYVYCISLGKAQNSKSLIATANDHLADVYASIAAVVGIGATLIGERYDIPFAQYGDPIAGMIVSYFVLKLAYQMGKESIGVLMEENVPSEQLIQLESIVRSIPQVKRIDRIRAREHGHYIIVDVRVSVSNNLTIKEGHDISRLIKNSIKNEIQNVEEVLVHLNPWYEEDGIH